MADTTHTLTPSPPWPTLHTLSHPHLHGQHYTHPHTLTSMADIHTPSHPHLHGRHYTPPHTVTSMTSTTHTLTPSPPWQILHTPSHPYLHGRHYTPLSHRHLHDQHYTHPHLHGRYYTHPHTRSSMADTTHPHTLTPSLPWPILHTPHTLTSMAGTSHTLTPSPPWQIVWTAVLWFQILHGPWQIWPPGS